MNGPDLYGGTLTVRAAEGDYSTLIVFVAADTPGTVGLSLTGGIRSTVLLTRNEAGEVELRTAATAR